VIQLAAEDMTIWKCMFYLCRVCSICTCCADGPP